MGEEDQQAVHSHTPALRDGQPSGLRPWPSLFKVPCVRWRPVDGAGKQVSSHWEGLCVRSGQLRSCLVVVSWLGFQESLGVPACAPLAVVALPSLLGDTCRP